MTPAAARIPNPSSHGPSALAESTVGAHVAIVDDDIDQSDLLKDWVEAERYRASVYDSARSFRDALATGTFDLAIVDWGLPDDQGPSLVEWLRDSRHASLPVMLLTVRRKETDIVHGLRAGADDYMVKPARQGEFLARVAALLRRSGLGEDDAAAIEVGPYRLDLRRRMAFLGGHALEMTDLEFDLAAFMFRRCGRIVGRDALLVGVWNLPADSPSRTVDTHMSRLRRKMQLSGQHGWRISSIYHHGYRLEAV